MKRLKFYERLNVLPIGMLYDAPTHPGVTTRGSSTTRSAGSGRSAPRSSAPRSRRSWSTSTSSPSRIAARGVPRVDPRRSRGAAPTALSEAGRALLLGRAPARRHPAGEGRPLAQPRDPSHPGARLRGDAGARRSHRPRARLPHNRAAPNFTAIRSITAVITRTSPVMTLMAGLMGALAWVIVVPAVHLRTGWEPHCGRRERSGGRDFPRLSLVPKLNLGTRKMLTGKRPSDGQP